MQENEEFATAMPGIRQQQHHRNKGPTTKAGGGVRVQKGAFTGEGRGDKRGFHSVTDKISALQGPMYDLQSSIVDNEEKKFTNACRLWVGNLPKGFTEKEFKELFTPYGELDQKELYYDEAKRFGFIRMDYKVNAEKAKQELHLKNIKNCRIIVRFSSPGCALKIRNLSPWVTNELLEVAFGVFGDLEKAIVITDDRGKPTGEGIIEFCRKNAVYGALRKCQQGLFFITASPRPVIVEPLAVVYDGDGLKEMDINKNSQEYLKDRQLGPRFAQPGSFESVYGNKWKQIYEIYDKKKEMLEKELLLEEKKLLEQIDLEQFEYETQLLRDQVREREEQIAFGGGQNMGGMDYGGGYMQGNGNENQGYTGYNRGGWH